MLRRLVCLVLFAAAGVGAFAYDTSVSVDVRWRVLPYQSLAVLGSSQVPDSFAVSPFAAPTVAARDGYLMADDAFRLRIASNIAWKLQLRLAGEVAPPGRLEVRGPGGTYVPLTHAPVLIETGSHGVYEVSVGLRQLAGGDVEAPIRLVATIMPD